MKPNHFSRKAIQASALGLIALVLCSFLAVCPASSPDKPPQLKTQGTMMILYFSHSGNTRNMAQQIQSLTGAQLVEVKTEKHYPTDYDTVVDVAKKELKAKARPVLTTKLPDLSTIDTVFVGYPSWWGTMPMAMFTLFETYDFKGKTLIPFITHEGSGFGKSVKDLKALNPQSKILDGLAIRGRSVNDSSTREDIQEWLTGLGIQATGTKK